MEVTITPTMDKLREIKNFLGKSNISLNIVSRKHYRAHAEVIVVLSEGGGRTTSESLGTSSYAEGEETAIIIAEYNAIILALAEIGKSPTVHVAKPEDPTQTEGFRLDRKTLLDKKAFPTVRHFMDYLKYNKVKIDGLDAFLASVKDGNPKRRVTMKQIAFFICPLGKSGGQVIHMQNKTVAKPEGEARKFKFVGS